MPPLVLRAEASTAYGVDAVVDMVETVCLYKVDGRRRVKMIGAVDAVYSLRIYLWFRRLRLFLSSNVEHGVLRPPALHKALRHGASRAMLVDDRP